ncbi:MAG: DegT/DnrJ/EryC1/StrS family aminotransferase [Tannerella sp.]|jgi:dTDP-4-amino-4,6-dideoxygalactose transaminase|nr:DegT/DnrJ/EryC1/StrS family aminotransferase [Tannerella sp.]
MDMHIQMVDLQAQYARLKQEIDAAISEVIAGATFINGPQVQAFCTHLADYLHVPHVIPCGNGTDAIRLALGALDVKPGDEVILPAFTYISAVEMVASLGLTPILIDVDPETFNLDVDLLERAISRQTKAIIAVHLFGQACDMEPVMKIAKKYKLHVIEDNAQSLGADYTFSNGDVRKAGTIARIGTTSFFPTKPLACFGDGGAVIVSDGALAERIRMSANHGQAAKYHHAIVGCNSRLDTMQAAILDVKLKYMDAFAVARRKVAQRYDQVLSSLDEVAIPAKATFSTHVYHQYTVQVKHNRRDALQAFLKEGGISSAVYYPLPVQEQDAYKWVARTSDPVGEAVRLSREALSLPLYPEMTDEQQQSVIDAVLRFFRK